jgi:hypothetical protein
MFIKKVLTDTERETMRDALRKDEVIIPTLLTILASRAAECKPSQDMLKDVCYPYRRAAKDGALIELDWLIEILTSNKE